MRSVVGELRSGKRDWNLTVRNRVGAAGFSVLLIVLCVGTAVAQGSGLALSVNVGFADTFKLGHWTPVAVTVRNQGSARDVELSVRTRHGDELQSGEYHTTYRHALNLPRGAIKRVEFTVLLESFSRPLEVAVKSGGRVLTSRRVDLRGRFTESDFVLVLGRDVELDHLNGRGGGAGRIVYSRPQRLPSTWQAYDGVRAVVVHGVSLETLSQARFEALEQWLALGGVLVVAGGTDAALQRTPRLRQLLPGRAGGVVRVESIEGLENALSLEDEVRDRSRQGLDLLAIEPTDGRVLVRWDARPLILERRIGFGKVLQLAFDPARWPFAHWEGTEALWRRLVANWHPPRLSSRRQFEDMRESENVVRAFVQRKAVSFPPHALIIAFTLFYILALGSAARLGGPLRGAVIGVPIFGMALGWFLFAVTAAPSGARVVSLAVIEPIVRSPLAFVRLDVGMYSNREGRPGIEFRDLAPRYSPAIGLRRGGVTTSWGFDRGTGLRAMPEVEKPFVLHALHGEDLVPFSLRAQMTLSAAAPAIELRNDSASALVEVIIAWRGRLHVLPKLASGAVMQVSLPPAIGSLNPRALGERLAARDVDAVGHYVLRKTTERFGALQTGPTWLTGRALLIARLEKAPGRLKTEHFAVVDQWAFVLAEIEVRDRTPPSETKRAGSDDATLQYE